MYVYIKYRMHYSVMLSVLLSSRTLVNFCIAYFPDRLAQLVRNNNRNCSVHLHPLGTRNASQSPHAFSFVFLEHQLLQGTSGQTLISFGPVTPKSTARVCVP